MAKSSIASKDIGGFAVLLAFFILAALVLLSSDQNGPRTVSLETSPDPSITNTNASGSRGLYEWTKKLGYHAQAWNQPFAALPNNAQILFCIAPYMSSETDDDSSSPPDASSDTDSPPPTLLTAAEGRDLKQWIKRGHTLILFTSSLPGTFYGEGGTPGHDTFASEIGITAESALGNTETRRAFAPMQPSRWTQGVHDITIHPGARLYRENPDGLTLFGDVIHTPFHAHGKALPLKPATLHAQPVGMVYSLGKGHVIAVSDDYFGCNANLCRADNAQYIYRLISMSAPVGANILFDEYHRSDAPSAPDIWTAIGRPMELAVIQLCLALVVVLFILIPRLGRPDPLQRTQERTSAEYVTSLAGLYQSAGATATALETIYRQFLRELCQKFGQPTDISLNDLATIAARRGRIDGEHLRKIFTATEQALESKKRITDKDMITLVRAIERMRKELGIA